MHDRIKKVCDTFSKSRFEIGTNIDEKIEMTEKQILENKKILDTTRSERINTLKNMVSQMGESGFSALEFQKWYVAREKLLYQTLSKLEVKNSLMRGLCWCPTKKVPEITKIIQEQNKMKSANATFKKVQNHTLTPPTYVQTNDFTAMFQEIVSTYGVPSYQEVNPAFFTTVTFPFLFGVMFGDICHGAVLLCIGLLLCFYSDTLVKSKSLFGSLIKIRYLVLLMGIFAIFCGFIYNDFAGLGLNFFKSCYYPKYVTDDSIKIEKVPKCVYPFGIDPFWKYSSRELQFENSFKMKLSIVIGVAHMFMGVCLKLVNSLFFKKTLDVFFEFLPQAIFLLAMFGYMDLLIIMKWATNYDADTSKAPNIITAIINMFIGFGKTTDLVFEAQSKINFVLLGLIVICIPLMLLPKPFLLKSQFIKREAEKELKSPRSPKSPKKQLTKGESEVSDSAYIEEIASSGFKNSVIILQPKDEEFNFSEAFVHQLIETIEYALGTISNTASYLRLWALSLAHAELSEVFMDYAIITIVDFHFPSFITTPMVFSL